MIAKVLSRKELGNALGKEILPRVEGGAAFIVPAHPQQAASVTRVLPQRAPLLRSTRHGSSATSTAHWVEEGFNAARYPTLIWVAEGEADFRLGVTRRMAAHDKKLPARYGCYIVSLAAHSFFLIPPGVPFSDASRPHWERPQLENARSRLLWFHVLPAGASIHACQTQGTEHTSTSALFLNETRLLPLVEFLFEELQERSAHSEKLARYYLTAFLLCLDRAVHAKHTPLEEDLAAPTQQHFAADGSTPVQRACRYIESNLAQKILLQHIAAHAYISTGHLNKLFRAELDTSVSAYLIQRRIERARSLLETTDLPISRIGRLCGFPSPPHFDRAFGQHVGVSPSAFRVQTRDLKDDSQ